MNPLRKLLSSYSSGGSSHKFAILGALFVTFLWSTSWVVIKLGLEDVPALTFAGLRYSLASLCLLPFVFSRNKSDQLRRLSLQEWIRLVFLGVMYYAITQGAQFIGLAYLPAVTVSVLFNTTAILVAGMGLLFLQEHPTQLQWIGLIIFFSGILTYFYPLALPIGQAFGLIVVIVGVLANASSSVLGRQINRSGKLSPHIVTVISMGIGSVLLLTSGLIFQGLPDLNLRSWFYIIWLAVVNSAFAFTLWNLTLRHLSAMESSVINGTMLIQIALLAWIFLGETLSLHKIAGLLLNASGALLVQIKHFKMDDESG